MKCVTELSATDCNYDFRKFLLEHFECNANDLGEMVGIVQSKVLCAYLGPIQWNSIMRISTSPRFSVHCFRLLISNGRRLLSSQLRELHDMRDLLIWRPERFFRHLSVLELNAFSSQQLSLYVNSFRRFSTWHPIILHPQSRGDNPVAWNYQWHGVASHCCPNCSRSNDVKRPS